MNKEQKNKLFPTISDILLPVIIEIQQTEVYPVEFQYNFSSDIHLRIEKNNIILFETLNYATQSRAIINRHRAPNPPEPIMLNKDNLISALENHQHLKFKKLDFILKDFATAMIKFLKDAEQYQKEIQDIISFSKNISLSKTRIVLLEKIINET